MNLLVKTILVSAALSMGQAAIASPQDDAQFIVQRSESAEWTAAVQESLRSAFVTVYFRPISGRGVSIDDGEAFMALIPDTDIAPYEDRLRAGMTENLMSLYSAEQLASIAAILRMDETATMADIMSGTYSYQANIDEQLAQARANAVSSGSDDPVVQGVEELVVQLEVFTDVMENGGAEEFGQAMAFSIGTMFTLMNYSRQISQIEREANNPVTIAAIETRGVLRFANPVQRQSMLRELSTTGDLTGTPTGSGIRFIRPPNTTTSN